MNRKIKRGDVIVIQQQFRTIGTSDYTGIVFSVSPMVLFPITGHWGNAVQLPQNKYTITTRIHLGFISRFFNILKSAFWIGRNMHRQEGETMDKITSEQEVVCNQSEFCNGCEHSEKHIKSSLDFPNDCDGFVCHHYNEYAECVTPENVIRKTRKVSKVQLEEILERVEEGTTTQVDADVLRQVLACVPSQILDNPFDWTQDKVINIDSLGKLPEGF